MKKVRDHDNEKPRRAVREEGGLCTVPSGEAKIRVMCDRKQSGASDVTAYDF